MGGTEFTGSAASDPGATRKMVYGGLTLLAILFSILMGYTASDRWEIYLRFFNADELVFPAATPIRVEGTIDGNEIPVSQLELQEKKIKIGDPVNVQVDGTNQEARV